MVKMDRILGKLLFHVHSTYTKPRKNIGRSNPRGKTFCNGKKIIYDFFQKLLSSPSDALNILWCKFSTGSPIYVLDVFVCPCEMCVCVWIYIYSSLQFFFFYSLFFSLQEKSLRVCEREGKNKIKGTKKRRKKEPNHKTSTQSYLLLFCGTTSLNQGKRENVGK